MKSQNPISQQKLKNDNESNNAQFEYIQRSNRMSLIMWAVINNNVVTKNVYVLFLTLEYAIIICYILACYDQAGSFPANLSTLNSIIHCGGIDNMGIIGVVIACILCTFIGLFVILVMQNSESTYYSKKNIIFKIVGLIIVLTTSVFYCTIMQSIIDNFANFTEHSNNQVKFLALILSSFGLISMILLVYLKAKLFNLILPNNMLPWGETLFVPPILRASFKTLLVIGYTFKTNIPILYVIFTFLLLIITVNLYLRAYQGYLFMQTVVNVYLFFDLTAAHLIGLFLISKIFNSPFYFYFVLLTYPVTLSGAYMLSKKIGQRYIVSLSDENFTNEEQNISCYLYMIKLYMNQSKSDDNDALHQVQFMHSLKCSEYFLEQEQRKLNKHQKQLARYKMMDEEERLELMADNQDSFKIPPGGSINTTQFQSQAYSKAKEEEKMNTSNISKMDNSMYPINNDSSTFVTNHYATTKKGGYTKKTFDTFDTKQTLVTVFDNDIKKKQMAFQNKEQVNTLHQANTQNLKKSKSIRRTVQHFFKKHFVYNSAKDFRLKLIKIFFILKVEKNIYLAHFMMLDFMQQFKNSNVIQRNQILVHYYYIDHIIRERQIENGSIKQLDLQNILEVSQLSAKFEILIDELSEEILEFWQSTISHKDSSSLFSRGIKISADFSDLQELYDKIDIKQNDKETKIYFRMAMFYKQVIFKDSEYMKEILKSKQAFMLRKLVKDQRYDSSADEKGLIMVKFNPKKPMIINFMNKVAGQLTGYEPKDCLGMFINTLMPQVVSENHQKYIDNFMATGKSKMLYRRNETFIKQKNGCVIPTYVFLFMNNQNRRNMIMLVEPNSDFCPFEDQNEKALTSFILADKDLIIYEQSNNLQELTGIKSSFFKEYSKNLGRDVRLPEILDIKNSSSELDNISSLDGQIVEVEFRYDDLLQNINQENYDYKIGKITPFQDFQQDFYYMKLVRYLQVGKNGELVLIAFNRNIQNNDQYKYLNEKDDDKGAKSTMKLALAFQNNSEQQIEESDIVFQVSSQSSQSSSNSQFVNKYQDFTSRVFSTATPKTLKFITQLGIFILIVMLGTSLTTMILTLNNLEFAKTGIAICQMSYFRFSSISQVRMLMRVMLNIANGYQSNVDSFVPDRFKFYQDMLETSFEQLRGVQNQLRGYTFPDQYKFDSVQIQQLSGNLTQYVQNVGINEGLNLYIAYGLDLIQSSQEIGQSYFKTKLGIITLNDAGSKNQTGASLVERQIYFMLYNSVGTLFTNVKEYAPAYLKWKISMIRENVTLITILCFVCIGLIVICGMAIIPLFSRIYSRIYNLLELFFMIDRNIKDQMIKDIQIFQEDINKTKHNSGIRGDEDNFKSKKRQLYSDNSSSTMKILLSLQEQKARDALKNNQSIDSSPKPSKFKPSSKFKPKKRETQGSVEEFGSGRDGDHKKGEAKIQKKLKSGNEILDDDDDENMKQQKDEKEIQEDESENGDAQKNVIHEININRSSDSASVQNFKAYIQKRKIFQAVVIMIITLCLCSYFFATYFMDNYNATNTNQSFDIFDNIVTRKSCGENVIFAIQDTYSKNKTVWIENDDGSQIPIVDYYHDTCLQSEANYNNYVKSRQYSFLDASQDYIQGIETSSFCDVVFSNIQGNSSIVNKYSDISICDTAINNITQQGMTAVLFTIYKTCQQLAIQFNTATNRDLKFIVSQLNGPLKELQDLLEVTYTDAQDLLITKTIGSIYSFFDQQKQNFIIIFSIFLILIAAVALVFGCVIFKRLKKEMLLSNKLLYIINYDSLSEQERNFIMNFLAKY